VQPLRWSSQLLLEEMHPPPYNMVFKVGSHSVDDASQGARGARALLIALHLWSQSRLVVNLCIFIL
jgi:hypothetical protein